VATGFAFVELVGAGVVAVRFASCDCAEAITLAKRSLEGDGCASEPDSVA
jgi:hypothetical protein